MGKILHINVQKLEEVLYRIGEGLVRLFLPSLTLAQPPTTTPVNTCLQSSTGLVELLLLSRLPQLYPRGQGPARLQPSLVGSNLIDISIEMWTQHNSQHAGSRMVLQNVYYYTALVVNSRILLMYTDTMKELPGCPVQNCPSGSFLF